MNPAQVRPNGFTLFELIVVTVIIGVVFAASSPYLFGTKTKAVLTKDTEALRNTLELTHQKALGAEGGKDHSVTLDPEHNNYTQTPGDKTTTLTETVSFKEPNSPRIITFSRLTGHSNGHHQIILTSKGFETTITVSELGSITSTLPQKP